MPKEQGPFGHPYGFFLADGLVGKKIEMNNNEDIIEYVPEYLVIFKRFAEIAKEYGLEL